MPAIVLPHGTDMAPRYVAAHVHVPHVYPGRRLSAYGPLNASALANRRQQIVERRRALGLEGKRKPVDQGIKQGYLPPWWAHAVPGANAAAAAAEGQFI